MLPTFQCFLPPDELLKYSTLFNSHANPLRSEISTITTQQLSKKIRDEIMGELEGESYAASVKTLIKGVLGEIPTESECQAIQTFIAYIDALKQNHKQQLSKQAELFNRKFKEASSLQQVNLRCSQSQTSELRRQVSNLNTQLILLQQSLHSTHLQNSTIKHQSKLQIESLTDQKYLLQRKVKELEQRLKHYHQILTKAELELKYEEYEADAVRLRMYVMGMREQEFSLEQFRRGVEQDSRRYQMCVGVYGFARGVREEMDAVRVGGDAIQITAETDREDFDMVNPYKQAYQMVEAFTKQLKSKHRLQLQTLTETHKHQLSQLQSQTTLQSQQIHSLTTSLLESQSHQQQLLNRLTSLQQVYCQLQSKLSSLESQRNTQQQQLLLLQSQLQSKQCSIRELTQRVETLQLERSSLHENLKLIVETSAKHQTTLEYEKSIVEQVVDKNYDLKIRIRRLEEEVEQKQQELQGVRKEWRNRDGKFEQQTRVLKDEIQKKDEDLAKLQKVISEMEERLRQKQTHITTITTNIQDLESKLATTQQLTIRIKQLQQQLRSSQQSLFAASQALQSLQTSAEAIHRQKLAVQAQNTVLKHTQTLVIQHKKSRDEQIRQLVEQVQDKLLRIRALQTEITAINEDYRKVIQQNSQLKTTLLQHATPKQPCLQRTLKNKQNKPTPVPSCKDKQKYIQSILNLNELINYMMNVAKGYDFTTSQGVRERSWVTAQGPSYLKKMQSTSNLEGKMKNYMRVQQIGVEDPKLRDVAQTFRGVMEYYLG